MFERLGNFAVRFRFALLGLLDMAVPGNVSDGYPMVNEALAGRLSGGAMAVLALAKIVGSSLSLGCGVPGGVFGPIFFIGATGGAAGAGGAWSVRVRTDHGPSPWGGVLSFEL